MCQHANFKHCDVSLFQIAVFQLNTLKDQIVIDRHTEGAVKGRRADLQKEASELTTYLKQNQDVTQTLMNVCQRYVYINKL